jgi:outer membrane protein TolC
VLPLPSFPSTRLACALSALALVAACQSPEAMLTDADEEAYELLDARRAELFDDPAGFRIEREDDSLRARLLAGQPAPAEPLGLADLLDIAAENSREYQTQKEGLYRAALDLALERWRLTTIASAGASGGIDGTGNDENLVGFSDDAASVAAGGSVGLSRLLGTGASIVGSIGASLFRVVTTGDTTQVSSDLSLAITQPLLRGAGKRITLEPLTQAERNLVYQVRSFERYRREFSVQVAQRLYGLLQQMTVLENQEANYRNLVALRERNEAVAAAGRLSQIEADQAQQNEVRSEGQLVSQRANLARTRDNLMLFLGLPVKTDLVFDREEFTALEAVAGEEQAFDEMRAIDLALAQRLDFMTTLDELTDAERKAYIARDSLRVGLDVDARIAPSYDVDGGLQYDWQSTSWSAGLSLDLPWNRIPQRNGYRNSLITLEVRKRAVEAASDGIVASVRDVIRVLENARISFQLAEIAVEIAERRVESTRLNLDYGRASTRDVLESEEALREARNSRASALVSLTLARLDLLLELEALRVDGEGITYDQDLLASLEANDTP